MLKNSQPFLANIKNTIPNIVGDVDNNASASKENSNSYERKT